MDEVQEEKTQDINTSEEKKSFKSGWQGKIDKAEFFFDDNKKTVTYLMVGLLVLVAGFVVYNYWYMPSIEAEAQNESFYSNLYFEKDSMKQALVGGQKIRTAEGENKTTMGLEQIANDYSGTKVANMANYEIGCIYMRQGKFEEAIEKFDQFSSTDLMISSIATGATGDCYMELGKTEDAIKYYLKAADNKSNAFTTPIYLKKAGMAYESQSQYSEAIKIYERIQREYGKSQEAKDIQKYITRVKVLSGI